jgi:phage terminase Nu1 subunit (DNA packaging protein)
MTHELLTEKEVAELLRLRPRTLQDWRQRGVALPYIRYTERGIRYRRRDVERFIDSREMASTADSSSR